MDIEQRSINSIRPYPKNPRRNDAAVTQVARSIENFGFRQPIVVDDQGVIVVGHTRYKAAQSLGMTEVPVTVMSGVSQSVIDQYRIADNRLNELAEWDDDLLLEELGNILRDVGDTELTGFTGADIDRLKGLDDVRDYTTKVDTPIYKPKGDRPDLAELINNEQHDRLVAAIDASECAEEVKAFLRQAAQRHRRFDYEQIAEYYCHADAATQRLMEASALVIPDIDTAIENGYVQMTDTLKQIFNRDHPDG
jgi:hypothetical protein